MGVIMSRTRDAVTGFGASLFLALAVVSNCGFEDFGLHSVHGSSCRANCVVACAAHRVDTCGWSWNPKRVVLGCLHISTAHHRCWIADGPWEIGVPYPGPVLRRRHGVENAYAIASVRGRDDDNGKDRSLVAVAGGHESWGS